MSALWDCNLRSNLRVQQRLSSKYSLSTLTCYHHYLLLLRNQPKQQQSNMRRTFWFGGGEGKKKPATNPENPHFCHQPPSRSFFFSKVSAGLLPRNRPTLDLVLSITNLPKTQEHFFVQKATIQMRGAKFTLLRVLSSRWSDGFWRGTVVFLRTLYSYKHMKKMDIFFFRDIALLIYSPWVFKLQLHPLWLQVGFIILQTY